MIHLLLWIRFSTIQFWCWRDFKCSPRYLNLVRQGVSETFRCLIYTHISVLFANLRLDILCSGVWWKCRRWNCLMAQIRQKRATLGIQVQVYEGNNKQGFWCTNQVQAFELILAAFISCMSGTASCLVRCTHSQNVQYDASQNVDKNNACKFGVIGVKTQSPIQTVTVRSWNSITLTIASRRWHSVDYAYGTQYLSRFFHIGKGSE